MSTRAVEGGAPRTARWEVALVAALLIAAAAMRLWHLGVLPPGLHVDEAFNILDARDVLAGARPVFLPANAGRDVLYTYLQAAFLGALGESIATARLASALAGTFTVLAVWAFTRTLPLARPRRVAVLTAAYLAFSYWHLHFSRFGIRAILFPLLTTLAVWAWWRLVGETSASSTDSASDLEASGRHHLWRSALLAGFLFGLAFYTHPVGRALWLIPAVHALYRWLRWRDGLASRALVPTLVVAGLVAAPLVGYWMHHPGSFSGHAGEVSILDRGPLGVAANSAEVAGMFNVAGDPAPWRNMRERPMAYAALAALGLDRNAPLALALRGRPVFDPLSGLLFLAGLAIALGAAWRGADWAALALIWLLALLAPSVLTDAAPNFSRAIGALPVVCLMPALALDRAGAWIGRRKGREWALALMVAAVGLHAISTSHDYFVAWARDPDTPLAFDSDKVALARYADELASRGEQVYLAPAMAQHPTVLVTASKRPAAFDPGCGIVVPPPGRPAVYVYERNGDTPPDHGRPYGAVVTETLLASGSPVVVSMSKLDTERWQALERLLGVTPLGAVEPPSWTVRQPEGASAAPGTVIRLAGLDEDLVEGRARVRAGEVRDITLVWESVRQVDADLVTAVQLVTTDGSAVAQADGPPLCGSHPTSRWRPGELIASTHKLDVAEEVTPGTYELRVGWYEPPRDGVPLRPWPLPSGETVATIAEIEVTQ